MGRQGAGSVADHTATVSFLIPLGIDGGYREDRENPGDILTLTGTVQVW